MPEWRDLLFIKGGPGGDRAMESALQHGTAAFVAGIQTTSAASHLAEGNGAWRYGKRCAFPTSPHPRRRLRTNLKRGVTLTIYLVQNTGQLTPAVHTSETSELTCRAANHEPRTTVCATLGSIRDGRPNRSHSCLASAQCRGYNSMNCS